MKPKSELIRFVKSQNTVELDVSGKLGGRGAYICKSEECISVAKKRRALSRHFKMATDDEIYDKAAKVMADE